MKKIIPFILLCSLLLTACENKHSVNILIANTTNQSFRQREIIIPLDTICMWLEVSAKDTLILLNEKNESQDFRFIKGRSAIAFIVPLIQGQSQKNYTINKTTTRLGQNLLAFRQKKIRIVLQ
ncbi:MAG: hypothetical protein IKN01_04405 [Prevotella sp.]|jgi:hypothetical protein|nr:hypothetical protein [Prevotella sp.]